MPTRAEQGRHRTRSKSPLLRTRKKRPKSASGPNVSHDANEISHKEPLSEQKQYVDGQSHERENFVACLCTIAVITYITMPASIVTQAPTVNHVWFYGWFAAVATGLGAVPLLFFGKPAPFWIALSNVFAAGMMLSASFSLLIEGLVLEDDGARLSQKMRTAVGVLGGCLFVRTTKSLIEERSDLPSKDMSQIDASKIFLIMSVMLVHSFAEGLAMGVAFCGKGGAQTGAFTSAAMAVHNIPEGVTISLVLALRGVPKSKTFAMAIMSSLPQPAIAVPAFLFVEMFIAWESVALGFAAGAMFWVACFALLSDAIQEVSIPKCVLCLGSAFAVMVGVSRWLDRISELTIDMA